MPKLKRRTFILGTLGAAGALVVGWAALPARQRLVGAAPLAAAPNQAALNGWVKVSTDDAVTVMVPHAEMGQGTHTGLAMLVADEMDADFSRIRVEQASYDAIYNNQAALLDALPFQPDDDGYVKRMTRHVAGRIVREFPGLAGTGGSASIKDLWLPLRQAGASARAMLVAAAAAQWKVSASELRVEAGRIAHASGRSATFGELALAAATLPVPYDAPLKKPSQFQLIGKPARRIEAPSKLDGSARFGIDALPDGLVYASVAMCPTLGGKAKGYDASAARTLPGVRAIVALEPVAGGIGGMGGATSGGVAVIADTPFHATRALEKIAIEWEHGAAASVDSATLLDDLSRALDTQAGNTHLERGDVDAALAAAARRITAEYRVPFLAHATMEPMNCTVRFKDGKATAWIPTQAPGFARDAVAQTLGIDAENVEVVQTLLGGGFGRRYFTDFVVQAATLARAANGAPVQLIWSREADMQHDYYRPAFVCRCEAGFDAQGSLVAWKTTSAGSSMGAPAMIDMSTDGASNQAYAFPAARVAHLPVETPVSVGIWRSVAHSQNAFFVESFVDEAAHAAGQDPVAFRASLLAGNARHLAVLHRAAELAGWGTPAAPGRAHGIALHRAFGSIVAQVAEVSVDADRIRVHRVVCVVDCGVAVNPNHVKQQMESGIVFGLSAALHGEITIENGRVKQSNFHDYAPLRMNECPAIETDIVASGEAPGGVGEPGTPPIAPAVANAVFALTGRRLRTLPLRLT
ncbi:xanthine dehydrogenase family protein molybdopterin-binding subunit [Tahibacter soli]|uniref:Molybdopterin-dependent oxidoreductase n=1 Tax=Tahibacter soli TaxID=2983605 RepID=A0A9X3YQ80_9GAMM|nr:molybdopterin cofactor-binding domain-containing protein [Tahibacter soli]MDC8015475.1 molybdopterin-dependent oxidoreductase [Tahibacter soli]